MMFVTSKHVFEIKKCRHFLKDNDLLSAVSTFWFHYAFCKKGKELFVEVSSGSSAGALIGDTVN